MLQEKTAIKRLLKLHPVFEKKIACTKQPGALVSEALQDLVIQIQTLTGQKALMTIVYLKDSFHYCNQRLNQWWWLGWVKLPYIDGSRAVVI